MDGSAPDADGGGADDSGGGTDESGGVRAAREQRRARALREGLESLGPFWIKVGQMLATRPDLVSEPVTRELRRLHDHAAPQPFATYSGVLREELGTRWERMFRSVDPEPLGTASLAQAHAAVLRDGRPAVVKIQRPGVDVLMTHDMRLLRRAASLTTTAVPALGRVVDLRATLDVLFDAMVPELDFTREAANMEAARPTLSRFPCLRVPDVYHASRRVLVQSTAPGTAVLDLPEATLTQRQRTAIGADLIAWMHRGYFVDHFFHADPHPGNILVHTDGTATVIDWGMVGRVDRRTGTAILLVLLNLALNDGQGVARAWLETCRLTPRSDIPGFTADVTAMVPRLAAASLAELDFGQALTQVMRRTARRHIQVNPAVAVLGKSFANIDGSVRAIAPGLHVDDVVRDNLAAVLADLARQRLDPVHIGRAALTSLLALDDLMPESHALLHGRPVTTPPEPTREAAPNQALRRVAAVAVAAYLLRRRRDRPT
ncbi:AarF/UbiB family protein [Streptantibioticus parmotrematis]|uniref:ABC1 kinase family protein n=1 Tax=Streptantibioticus parmotrematis TaxID=2873249 RepID=UPI0033C677B5